MSRTQPHARRAKKDAQANKLTSHFPWIDPNAQANATRWREATQDYLERGASQAFNDDNMAEYDEIAHARYFNDDDMAEDDESARSDYSSDDNTVLETPPDSEDENTIPGTQPPRHYNSMFTNRELTGADNDEVEDTDDESEEKKTTQSLHYLKQKCDDIARAASTVYDDFEDDQDYASTSTQIERLEQMCALVQDAVLDVNASLSTARTSSL